MDQPFQCHHEDQGHVVIEHSRPEDDGTYSVIVDSTVKWLNRSVQVNSSKGYGNHGAF
jgi:hypothetical protein